MYLPCGFLSLRSKAPAQVSSCQSNTPQGTPRRKTGGQIMHAKFNVKSTGFQLGIDFQLKNNKTFIPCIPCRITLALYSDPNDRSTSPRSIPLQEATFTFCGNIIWKEDYFCNVSRQMYGAVFTYSLFLVSSPHFSRPHFSRHHDARRLLRFPRRRATSSSWSLLWG